MAQEALESNNTRGIIFDSSKLKYVGEPYKTLLPRYYFPLVIGIILTEAIILVLVLLDMLPIHVSEFHPEAGYFSYIGANDVNKVSVTITRWFFFLLAAGVLIPTTLIIMLETTRQFINSRRGESDARDEEYSFMDKLDNSPQDPALFKDRVQGDYIKRFDIHQRIQHVALFTSFIILAITGIPRGFPEMPLFAWFTGLFGGTDLLRLVHDAAAFVMAADCFYHLGYLAYGYFVKHRVPNAMVPKLKDLKDVTQTFLWIFGKRRHEPDSDHFHYGQKIDYLAIFWGMPVMFITGIVMMLPAFFSQWLSGEYFAVMATAHRHEAVLAILFIIIVHIYYGHFHPGVFPVNTVMFTGKMLKSKYKQRFGREYSRIMGDTDAGK